MDNIQPLKRDTLLLNGTKVNIEDIMLNEISWI